MRKDLDEKKDWIEEQLKAGVPRAQIARELRCKYDTLKARLEKWDLDHLKNQSGRGRTKQGGRVHVSEHLGPNGRPIHSSKLREKLWRDGYKEKRCEECDITEWNGKPAPLELDHINGNHYDNTLENLRILCANCHAQTPTNSGKNKGTWRNWSTRGF